MPSEYIKGKDVMLYFYVAGVWRPCACYTNVVLNLTHTLLETTDKNSGGWEFWKKSKSGWTATAEGVQYLDAGLRFDDVRQWGIDGRPLLIMFSSTGVKGTMFATWKGYCLVESDSSSGAVLEPAPYSLALRGNGALEADFETINLDEQLETWHYYTGTGNEGNVIVFDTAPHDLRGKIPNFRVHRGGYIYEPSGTLAEGRDATQPPSGYQYQWDIATGTMTFDPNFANIAFDEKFLIPYVDAYSGCTLSIDGLAVGLDSNNVFYLTWNGTGIPENQLLFERSADYGATYVVAGFHVDPMLLDNATSEEALDPSLSHIFRLTPVCGNGAKGTADMVYWNTTIIYLTNNRTDTLIQSVNYTLSNGTQTSVSALNPDNTQKTVITNGGSPMSSSGNAILVTLTTGRSGAVVTIEDKAGNILAAGTASTSPYTQISIFVPNGLPNEFKIILS